MIKDIWNALIESKYERRSTIKHESFREKNPKFDGKNETPCKGIYPDLSPPRFGNLDMAF